MGAGDPAGRNRGRKPGRTAAGRRRTPPEAPGTAGKRGRVPSGLGRRFRGQRGNRRREKGKKGKRKRKPREGAEGLKKRTGEKGREKKKRKEKKRIGKERTGKREAGGERKPRFRRPGTASRCFRKRSPLGGGAATVRRGPGGTAVLTRKLRRSSGSGRSIPPATDGKHVVTGL